ncbi:protein of unknown function [Burkholderia multivorans]
MYHDTRKISEAGFGQPGPASSKQVSGPQDETKAKKLTDEELISLFENLAPPPELIAKQRLEKMMPSLAKARRNGNSVQSLADTLKVNGIDVSHVTLRKKLDEYEKKEKAMEAPSRNGDAGGPVAA